MTIRNLIGAPRLAKDVLEEFLEDLGRRKGWVRMGEVMDLVGKLEQAPVPFYVIGSRAWGHNKPDSDLDLLAGGNSDGPLGGIKTVISVLEGAGLPMFDRWGPDLPPTTPFVHATHEDCYGAPYRVLHTKDRTLCLDFQLYVSTSILLAWEKAIRMDVGAYYAMPKIERNNRFAGLFASLETEAYDSLHNRKSP